MFNLMVGLNGYTLCSGIICEKLNGTGNIAEFLSSINRCWNKAKWKSMLNSYLKMTEKEATLRLQGKYTADINVFESIENEAFEMADYMFCEIIKTHT